MTLRYSNSPASTDRSPGPHTVALHPGMPTGLRHRPLHMHLHCTVSVAQAPCTRAAPRAQCHPQPFVGTDFEDASASNQREAVASGERYVDKLNEELGKRAPMFVDDANFIRCARSACGMSACSHVGS